MSKNNKITIKDVRLGDWVLQNGMPHQISILDLKALIRCFENNQTHFFEAMPLTNEILEKNCSGSQTGDTYIKIFIFGDIDGSGPSIEIETTVGGNKFWISGLEEVCFEYVHELQALLFAFGIEKNIKL